jgi:hypothetical protein
MAWQDWANTIPIFSSANAQGVGGGLRGISQKNTETPGATGYYQAFRVM